MEPTWAEGVAKAFGHVWAPGVELGKSPDECLMADCPMKSKAARTDGDDPLNVLHALFAEHAAKQDARLDAVLAALKPAEKTSDPDDIGLDAIPFEDDDDECKGLVPGDIVTALREVIGEGVATGVRTAVNRALGRVD